MSKSSSAWDVSGVYGVATGVHRIPLSLPDDGLRAVNTYVIEDGDGLVIIDPGQMSASARSELQAGLSQLGYTVSDIKRCLVTHVHRDHYTNAIALRRELGCSVSLGVGERASLEAINVSTRYGLDPHLDGLAPCGAEFLVDEIDIEGTNHGLPHDIWEQPDEWLNDGDVIRLESRELHVMHTPGHTIGHVTFHDVDAALLFSGDHVLPRITPSIGFEPLAAPLPLADFLSSLARVTAAPDAMLAPAHGPVTESAHQRVAELLEHHEQRLVLTEDEVQVGERTVHEVAQHLLWTRRNKKLDVLDSLNQMLAILETKAHLDLLAHRGMVDRRVDDGLLLYFAPERSPHTV